MNLIQKQWLVYGAAAMFAMVAFPPWTKITQHVTPALDKSAVQTETQESAGYSWFIEPPKTTSQTERGFGNYSKHAEVTVPSLDDWEKEWENNSQRSLQPKLLPVDFRSPSAAIAQSN